MAIVVLLLGVTGISFNSQSLSLASDSTSTTAVIAAMGIAFWSFLGVEAMAHLANDFKDPKKDMIPAMMIDTVLVGLIYLGCTLLVLLVPSSTDLTMVGIFDQMLGGYGAQMIGVLGIAGGLATVNVYTASVARLTWSFSRDGVLPSYFSKLNRFGVPIRALSTLLLIMASVLVITWASKSDLEDLIAWSNGVFVIIYFASMLAAQKLLGRENRWLILLGCLFCFMLSYGLGWSMLYAFVLIAITAPFLYWQFHYQARKAVSA